MVLKVVIRLSRYLRMAAQFGSGTAERIRCTTSCST